jgi:hypothetical protein
MAQVAAPVLRSVITDDEFGGFRITISPSYRTRLVFWGVVALWGCGVVLAQRSIAGSLASLTLQGLKPLGFWLCALFLIWLFAALNGMVRELMIIDGKSLTLRKEFAWFVKERRFELAEVRNLRPIRTNEGGNGRPRPDSVAFDHEGRTYRFGISLSEQEVLRLIKTIRLKVLIRDDWSEVEPLPVMN